MHRWVLSVKMGLKEIGWGCGVNSFGWGYGLVVGCCKNSDETLGSMKGREFDWQATVTF